MEEVVFDWKQAPEVFTGGKQNFWVKKTTRKQLWVVWDRVQKRWAVQDSQQTFAYFDNAIAAMEYADELFAQTSLK